MTKKYAAFFSYAIGDNDLQNGYVRHIHACLSRMLAGHLGTIPQYRNKVKIYIDHIDLPSGDLNRSLKDAVSDSYALVIVVGPNYIDSEWCLKELHWFVEANGGSVESVSTRVFFLMLPDNFNGEILEQSLDERLQEKYLRNGLGEITTFKRVPLWFSIGEDPEGNVDLIPIEQGRPPRPFAQITNQIAKQLAFELHDKPPSTGIRPVVPQLRILIEQRDHGDTTWKDIGLHLKEIWANAFFNDTPKVELDTIPVPTELLCSQRPKDGAGVVMRSERNQHLFSQKCEGVKSTSSRSESGKIRPVPCLIAQYVPPMDQPKLEQEKDGWYIAEFDVSKGTAAPVDNVQNGISIYKFMEKLRSRASS